MINDKQVILEINQLKQKINHLLEMNPIGL